VTHPSRYNLSDAEKDALLAQQAEMIERLVARIGELEALVGKPRKTSKNSSIPPSKDGFGRCKKGPKRPGRKRPPREGKARALTPEPDKTERRMAEACGHCGADLSSVIQRRRRRYDHIDLPVIRPIVTRVELFGGRCQCGRRFCAEAPVGMAPGTPFGPGVRSLLMYLHHSHHISFERLPRWSDRQPVRALRRPAGRGRRFRLAPDALPTPAQAEDRSQDPPRLRAQGEGTGAVNTGSRNRPCSDAAGAGEKRYVECIGQTTMGA
jgi:transposase